MILVFLFLLVSFPHLSYADELWRFAPGVTPRLALMAYAYDWSPDGKQLAYVTDDGVWIVEAPDFQTPRRLVRKGHCSGDSCPAPQLLWSPDGTHLALMDSRPGDGWSTVWVREGRGGSGLAALAITHVPPLPPLWSSVVGMQDLPPLIL